MSSHTATSETKEVLKQDSINWLIYVTLIHQRDFIGFVCFQKLWCSKIFFLY